jgi:prevent-host-death family protein
MLYSVHRARAQLSRLVERAARGEEIILAKRGKPLDRLIAVEDREPRCPGLARGRLTDAFFEPLPPEELEALG